MEGRAWEEVEEEVGGMFSVSEEGAGGLGGEVWVLGLFRRAHTEAMSIVAPEDLGMVDFLDSSLVKGPRSQHLIL